MTDKQTVQIGEAKGRPMLHWVGKRPLDYVTAFPAQLVETFNPSGEATEAQGLLFHGDNKDVLAWLLAHGYRGKVHLIYIDPPFDSGADYIRQVRLRGIRTSKLDAEAHSLGEQIQYTDIWVNDSYLQFMYERVLMLKELLAEDGSIYVHCDPRKSHHLRCVMDEVFGTACFCNHIIWSYRRWPSVSSTYQNMHDDILFYSKSPDSDRVFRIEYEEASEGYLKRFKGKTQKLDEETGTRKIPVDEDTKGLPVRDVWGISIVAGYKAERTGFPTQKPEALVDRMISTSSNPGDLVLDCFAGSGTTAAVAQKLGRRWIAADINKGAIQTTSKRLQTVIREQIEAGATPRQLALQTSEVSKTSEVCPATLSFSVYRVNDYDLQVQHNEAISLTVEHIGIQRTKTDVYFDGTLGKRLVKIVPFTHPLTLLDLQLLQDELKARPDEERDIVLVCLGKETAIDPWLEDYNKRHPVNKIEVIELRTDQKYGKFFVHQPAQAQVKIGRRDGNILVEIEDFISPTIVERLEMDTPLFKAQIPDWRAMVDVVLIDTAYDGEVFDITLSDVPERKDDLVSGAYQLPAPEGATTVAVKIVDMLGEEVLVEAEV